MKILVLLLVSAVSAPTAATTSDALDARAAYFCGVLHMGVELAMKVGQATREEEWRGFGNHYKEMGCREVEDRLKVDLTFPKGFK